MNEFTIALIIGVIALIIAYQFGLINFFRRSPTFGIAIRRVLIVGGIGGILIASWFTGAFSLN